MLNNIVYNNYFFNKIGREISIPLTSMRDKSDWVVSSSPSLVSEGFYFIKKGTLILFL